MTRKLLAFGCQARVGKDTSADYLIQTYGGIKLSFASPIYDILFYAQRVCGFRCEKDRKFLQYVGTDWARSKNKDVWIDIIRKKIRECPPDDNIYITDLRFENEAEMLRKEGFLLIRINRPVEVINHPSEGGLTDNGLEWDYTIDNSQSINSLFSQLDAIMLC